MRNARYLHISSLFLIYSAAQFVVLTLIAMWFYPGGNFTDFDAPSYSFFNNFFSDLGVFVTRNGQSNMISSLLFVVALTTVGIALIFFVLSTQIDFIPNQKGRLLQLLACVTFLLSGISFIGIAAIPWNTIFFAHIFFVKSAFSFLSAAVFCLFILQVLNPWPNRYRFANLLYLLFLIAYLFILFNIPLFDLIYGISFQAISQKIIVYISMINLGYQALGINTVAKVS